MSGTEEVKDLIDGAIEDADKSMPSTHQEEEAVKKKYGGIIPKKPPLISKDHERAYFDSADWALGKQGVEKPKGPLEALRPKLQPTQQQTRYRKSPCAPSEGEDARRKYCPTRGWNHKFMKSAIDPVVTGEVGNSCMPK